MSFLSLPAELRLQIYRLVLVHDEPFTFVTDTGVAKPPHLDASSPRPGGSLLLVNKVINTEATPLLYSNNRFCFEDAVYSHKEIFATGCEGVITLPCIAPVFDKMGSANVALLRHVGITFPSVWSEGPFDIAMLHQEYMYLLWRIKRSCPALRTLEIRCHINLSDEWPKCVEILKAIDAVGPSQMPSLDKVVLRWSDWRSGEAAVSWHDGLKLHMPSPKYTLAVDEDYQQIWVSGDERIPFFEYEAVCRYNEIQGWRELRRAKGILGDVADEYPYDTKDEWPPDDLEPQWDEIAFTSDWEDNSPDDVVTGKPMYEDDKIEHASPLVVYTTLSEDAFFNWLGHE